VQSWDSRIFENRGPPPQAAEEAEYARSFAKGSGASLTVIPLLFPLFRAYSTDLRLSKAFHIMVAKLWQPDSSPDPKIE
jgi:hypothetical protein